MKSTNTAALAVLVGLSFGAAHAATSTAQIKTASDQELTAIKKEVEIQKTLTERNTQRAKELKQLAAQTDRLLDSQERYIDTKLESEKAIREYYRKMADNEKRLQCMLNESIAGECAKYVPGANNTDTVSMGLAAPSRSATSSSNLVLPTRAFQQVKVMPIVGATNYLNGDDSLETGITPGIRVESNINERVNVGVGLSRGQFETEDFSQNCSGGFCTNYNAFFNDGRDVSFENWAVDVYGKYTLVNGDRFRPYVGGGLAYNRMNLEYTEDAQFNSFGSQFGNEELTSSFVSANLLVGSAIIVNSALSFNIEGSLSRGITTVGSTDNNVNPFNAPDQRRLEELRDDIVDSTAASLFLGAALTF